MSDHTSILPPTPTSSPAAVKDVMSAQEQWQNEIKIQPLQKTSIQFKLSIGSPNDPLEQEADAMADTIMRMPESNFIQRNCSHCEEEEKVQRKPLISFIQRKESSTNATVSDAISNQIYASKGIGNLLDSQTQTFMQNRFGTDFSDVKIHTGDDAIQMSREIGAQAFTYGNDIYFNKNKFDPQSSSGKHLLAHELSHVVQQTQLVAQRKTTINSPETSATIAILHSTDNGKRISRTVNTPVSRRNATQIFGSGASTGFTLAGFEQYTRSQADWFTDASLTQAQRDDLWRLLIRATNNPSVLTGVGDIRLSQLRLLNAAQWANLEVFCRGCHSNTHTVRISTPASYSTLQQRINLGTTLSVLEQHIPPDVLELTVSEVQLREIHASPSLMGKINLYWHTFSPHLQHTFEVAPNARGPEFQQVLNLLSRSSGITPFMPLLGRIRNLHRFTVPTLTKLVQNFANTTRAKPVHLVIMSGHDASNSFSSDRPLLQTLVTTSPNLVLILEGPDTVAALTSEIPRIAATYGKADATGVHRIAQVMISGHGNSDLVELTGTGSPNVDHANRTIDYQSQNIRTTEAATQTFVDTILQNLDPATARIVFNGCLVGSNPIPDHVADADIGTFINNHPNMKTFVESRATALGLGMPANFVHGARASLGALTGLMDPAGNLEARSTDRTAFGDAANYAANGHEPEGVMTSAVELASTNPLLAADKLRERQNLGISASRGWWDQCTMVFVNVAMSGVNAGQPVNLSKVRQLSHMVSPPFLARWDFGITVNSFISKLNNANAVFANDIYQEIDTAPMTVFRTPPDNDARKMRLLIEQARIALGHARIAEIISTAALFPASTAVDTIHHNLDVTAIGTQSTTIFTQAVSPGLIRLALAWLFSDPSNADMLTFLRAQVSTTTPAATTTPVSTLSAAVLSQRGTRTERDILEALGLLAPIAPPSTTSATPDNFGNAQGVGSADNNLFIEPAPSRRMAILLMGTTTPVLQQPLAGSTQLGILNPADEVNVTGTSGAFSAIDFNGQLGFVQTSDLF